MILTQQLHLIRAHHLHYVSLLDDFGTTVRFIRDTANPALDALSPDERAWNADTMQRECANLLREVARLESERAMQEWRVKNVLDLVSPTDFAVRISYD
jgi:pyruvate-formate lyase